MELRHLRYFLAVADELHFGRAARLLHMSQPPLSARIKDLEREVGTALFERSSKGVTLTAAGIELLPAARQAVEAFDRAQRIAHHLRPEARHVLRVAITPDTSAAALQTFLESVREFQPDTRVAITEASTGEQVPALQHGQLDLGLLRHPFPEVGLHVEPALSTPAGALMATTHPLARQSTIRAADLAHYPLVLFPRAMAPGLYDETLASLMAAGLHVRAVKQITRLLGGLLTTDNAVAIRHPGMSFTGDLTWRPIADIPLTWRTSVVWTIPPAIPAVDRFARALAEALIRHDQWTPPESGKDHSTGTAPTSRPPR
ncbi:DNA-binding transcriptional LysR family regulator [Thermocatellispora tengchongensis]|uniref:DNA-binding transcriptional LysR family regulator n=1 Tax=Thermocatellispora tengchongensis TaxID=1073253 RepID=A0A840PEF8_9ACTN|nr:LysR family transcriptional regulator [Thermocatellispora tengchongensis]MBB5135537.1 DNA-binding transcriptional LysR family regulator [Thermocatellispora tengchongensis]